MEDKTIHYTIAFGIVFICLLGINQVMHTQEKNIPTPAQTSKISPALAAYTGASLACAAIGSRLPYGTPAATMLMRKYFLTGMTAQTVAGTAASLSETLKPEKPSWSKATADIGYGAYNMAFVELARRLPTNTAARALIFKRYATFCLVSQALGVVGKDYAGPAFCAIKKSVGDYTASLDPEKLEETAACLSLTE